jgi:hypothetical protein
MDTNNKYTFELENDWIKITIDECKPFRNKRIILNNIFSIPKNKRVSDGGQTYTINNDTIVCPPIHTNISASIEDGELVLELRGEYRGYNEKIPVEKNTYKLCRIFKGRLFIIVLNKDHTSYMICNPYIFTGSINNYYLY